MESTNALGVPRQHEPATIVDIKVSTGDSVAKQVPLLVYEHKVKYDPALAESEDRNLLKALKKNADSDGYISKREFLRTPFEGTVASLSCAIGDVVRHGDVLVEITVPCGHGAVFNGLCGLCGKDVSGIDTSGLPDSHANIDMFHDATGLKVSYEVAANIDADTRNSLWDQKKLSLIIDLDQTIIHANATLDPNFEGWLIDNYDGPQSNGKGKEKEASEDETPPAARLPSDVGSFYLSDSPLRYYIKMRPGLQDFLERISQLYEMHIYTMGTKPYANAVAAMIDPERRYFNGRILSRDESGSMTRKTLKRLFPVDTSMVVILDDRADVWEWSPNLIKVHPYEFFRGVGDINAGMLPNVQRTEPAPSADGESADVAKLDGVSDSTGNHPRDSNDPVVQAERSAVADGRNTQPGTPGEKRPQLVDADRELVTIQSVLTNLHQKYYDVLDDLHNSDMPDVAQLLASKRRQVLSGVTIVFTAAFPINQGAPPPHKNDLWQWAQSFGARCELEINERTTHVVAGKPGTEKVHSARRMRGNNGANSGGRSPPVVVKTNWLLDSIGRWESLDETPYLWYDEDKDVVVRSRRHLSTQSNASDSPSRKRKENDSLFPDRDSKQPKRQLAAIQRLKGQQEASSNFDSANTTDIEDELERQEAGLEEHEAEVDDFVQTIDWDDLEREAMEDSDSDYASDNSQQSSPGARHSRSQSRTGTSPSLRNAALLQATQKRQQEERQASTGRQRRSGTGGDVLTDSSDVYADSSSSECSSGGEDHESGSQPLAERHRMKRRKTSPDSTKQRREAASRRRSKLANNDGSLDIGTNTEGTEDSEADADDSSDHKLPAKTGDMRKRLANKLGISLKPTSILDHDNGSQANNSDSDDDSDRYAGRDRPDAPLFAGIEDPPVVGFENDKEDDSEFEEAGSQQSIAGDDNDADGGESEQWGEDDDDDDENFDDLINNLEEEISRVFDASRKGQRIVANIYSATETISSDNKRTKLTLLLAHANGFHKELWEPTLERVFAHKSESWYIDQAIALDSYNHGDSAIANRSSINNEDFSPWTENSRDILAILAQLGSSRNIVGIGHSWGASSLLLAEIMAPLSFANLIITDPVLHSGGDQSASALAKLTLKRRYQWSTAEEARQYFNNHPFFRIWDQRIIDLHLRYGLELVGEKSLVLKCRPSNESAVYLGSRDDSPYATQNLSKVHCPVAFLTGETSEQSPPAHITRITKNMVDCRHVVMNDVGHLLLHQDPDRTADQYIEFLDGFVSKKPCPTANL